MKGFLKEKGIDGERKGGRLKERRRKRQDDRKVPTVQSFRWFYLNLLKVNSSSNFPGFGDDLGTVTHSFHC